LYAERIAVHSERGFRLAGDFQRRCRDVMYVGTAEVLTERGETELFGEVRALEP
jgi:hypothetical protein